MYRAQPIFNRVCVDKEMERKRDIHRQKLRNMQSTFREKTPQNYSLDYKLSRLKKDQQYESKYTEIERENRILLEKITNIMAKNTIQLNYRPGSPKSLNLQTRKRFVSNVQDQNYLFLRRLQDKKSNYSVKQWESDFQKNQDMVSKISQYPLNLFNSPKDGSFMCQNTQYNQSIYQKCNNSSGNINIQNLNGNNYSPENTNGVNESHQEYHQISQNQYQSRPNTSQIRQSYNNQQNFYSQNNTIQQQNTNQNNQSTNNQKSQTSSSPHRLIRNQGENKYSDQPNYNNLLHMNNSSFDKDSDQQQRMPIIHSNPSSTKHTKNNKIQNQLINGQRSNTFYNGNLKSSGSKENYTRRQQRAKSNHQGNSQKRKKTAIDRLNKNNSIQLEREGSQIQNDDNNYQNLLPTNESTVILYKKPKKISGEFFKLEIRSQDNYLIILAEHIENQELKIIEIPQLEAEEFIKEECDNDINSLALRLRLHNGKLYLIGTKALQNSGKKISVTPTKVTTEHNNNPISILESDEKQSNPQQNNSSTPKNLDYNQKQVVQQSKQPQKNSSNSQKFLNNNTQANENAISKTPIPQMNTVIPNQIDDNHEEQPPYKIKK